MSKSKRQLIEDKKIDCHSNQQNSNTKYDDRAFLYARTDTNEVTRAHLMCEKLKNLNFACRMKRIVDKNGNKYIRLSFVNKNYKKLKQALNNIGSEMNMKIILRKKKTANVKKARVVSDHLPHRTNDVRYKDKPIRILSLNINHIKNKYMELREHVLISKPEIILIQESHRTSTDARLVFDGYDIYEHLANENIGANGLLILINKEITGLCSIEYTNDFLMSVKIQSNTREAICIVNCYRPCSEPSRTIMMNRLIKFIEKKNTYICIGDWNTPKLELIDSLEKIGIPIYYDKMNVEGGSRNTQGTESREIIDFAISNRNEIFKNEKSIKNWHLSDHYPISIELNIKDCKKDEPKRNEYILDRKKIHEINVRKKILNFNYKCNCTEERPPQEYFSLFYLDLLNLMKNTKILKKNEMCKKKKIFNNSIRTLVNMKMNCSDEKELKIIKENLKNEIMMAIRNKYNKFIEEGCEYLKKADSRNAWKWTKMHSKMNRTAESDSPFMNKNDNNKISENDNEKAEIARNHLANLAKKEDQLPAYNNVHNEINDIKNITDADITWSEIITALKSCNNFKAASKDHVPCEIYKIAENDLNCEKNFSKALLKLMRLSFDKGFIPNEWKENIVVLLYKKGEKSDLDNYRGITLINTLSKILCKVMAKRIEIVNTIFSIIRREQIGFIKEEEGLSAVMSLIEICQRRKAMKMTTWICFLDLKKAYDLVPHELLINKLKGKGIGLKFTKMIDSLYKETKLQVRIKNTISENFKYERGVRQGCPTSPLLFDIFIDDLLNDLKEISIPGTDMKISGQCFADDTVIFGDTQEDIENSLNKIDEWMKNNCMEINPKKCGIMSFPTNPCNGIMYKNEIIEYVPKYTYLGVEINLEMDFEKMATNRLGTGWQTLAQISPTLKSCKIPTVFKRMLIMNVLIPRITYGIAIFGSKFENLTKIKKLVNNAIGMMVGKYNFNRHRAYEELGCLPLEAIAKFFAVKAYYKWKELNSVAGDLIRNEIYICDGSNKRKFIKSWCNSTHEFIKRNKLPSDMSKTDIKEKVREIFEKKKKFNPKNNINDMSKELNLGNGKKIQKMALQENSRKMCRFIEKARLGTLLLSEDFKRSKKLKEYYFGKCLSCEKTCKDNIGHILIDCDGFKNARENILKDAIEVIKKVAPNHWRTKLLSFLLIGNVKLNVNIIDRNKMNISRENFINEVNEMRQNHVIRSLN